MAKKLNVHDVLIILEDYNSFSSANIYFMPLVDSTFRDEDTGDDDDGGFVDNLSRHQLESTKK